mgnify:CR=1 FL=1
MFSERDVNAAIFYMIYKSSALVTFPEASMCRLIRRYVFFLHFDVDILVDILNPLLRG